MVRVRRYRCRHCRAVCTVVPRGVVRRRHFSAGAIGWALFLFGCEGRASREIRDRVGGLGNSEATRWVTLSRWLAAVERGEMFLTARSPSAPTPRERAARTAMTLVSFAAPELASAPFGAQAFAGAEMIAHTA